MQQQHLRKIKREREKRHKKCKIEIFSQHIVVSYLQSMLCSLQQQDDVRLGLFVAAMDFIVPEPVGNCVDRERRQS